MKHVCITLTLAGVVFALSCCSDKVGLDSSTHHGGGMPDPNALYEPHTQDRQAPHECTIDYEAKHEEYNRNNHTR